MKEIGLIHSNYLLDFWSILIMPGILMSQQLKHIIIATSPHKATQIKTHSFLEYQQGLDVQVSIVRFIQKDLLHL